MVRKDLKLNELKVFGKIINQVDDRKQLLRSMNGVVTGLSNKKYGENVRLIAWRNLIKKYK